MVFEYNKIINVNLDRDTVWSILKDDLISFSKNIKNVKSIKKLNHIAENENIENIKNEWELDTVIPEFIAAHIKDSYLKYIDDAKWNNKTKICNYICEPSDNSKSYTLRGKHTFKEIDENNSIFELSIKLDLDSTKIFPSAFGFLPKWVKKNPISDKIFEQVEKFLALSIADSSDDMMHKLKLYVQKKKS